MQHKIILLIAALGAAVYAGTKPPPIPGFRMPIPLSPWEARMAVTLEADIIADAQSRILTGQGRIKDYILLRFALPEECSDEELSEARRVLLHEAQQRMQP